MEHEYVTCSFCGRKYAGIMPKNGDGSVLFPRKHKLRLSIPISTEEANRRIGILAVYCEGSFRVAKEFEDKA